MILSSGFMQRARAMAESLMTDSFTIRRATGGMTVDPETGVSSPVTVEVWSGHGKVQTAGGIASQVVSASGDSSNVGGMVPVWSLYLHLPVSATGLEPGDLATCDASSDPDLVGRRYRLVNMQSEKTFATARRWNVQEQTEAGS